MDPVAREWVAAERLTASAGQDVAAAFAPVGGRLAFSVQRQSTRLWVFPFDASTGRIAGQGTPFTPEDGRAQTASLSPDGKLAAFVLVLAGRSRAELDGHRPGHQQGGGVRVGWFWIGLVTRQQNAGVPADASRYGESGRICARGREMGGGTDHPPLDQDSFIVPWGWTPDGKSIICSYMSRPFIGRAKLVLWPLTPSPAQTGRMLIEDPRSGLWQGSFSPNGRWLTFVGNSPEDAERAGIYVAREGAPPADWIRIAADHPWADKPRWAPNGRLLYFISNQGSPYFNLWAIRFDPDRGIPMGDPFQLTRFDTSGLGLTIIGCHRL